MEVDIVEQDKQNHLVNPIDGLDPYPLSSKDKPVDASKVETPIQNPTVTNDSALKDEIKKAIGSTISNNTPLQEDETEKKEEYVQQPTTTSNIVDEQNEVHEQTPEEYYNSLVEGYGKKQDELVYYIPETGKSIVTKEKDFEKAKFNYLSFKMQQDYLLKTHNYSDYKYDVKHASRGWLDSATKAIGGMLVDAATSTASAALNLSSNIAEQSIETIDALNKSQQDFLKFCISLNNPSGMLRDMSSDIISDQGVQEMQQAGSSPEMIGEYVKKKFITPIKFENSPKLNNRIVSFEKKLKQLDEKTKDKIDWATKSYQDFRKINESIKESLNLNIDKYDNPNAVYWGNIAGSTILSSAGLLSGSMGWLMPVVFASMEWDEAIQEGLENGNTLEEAMAKSYGVAAISLITEKLQLNSILRRYPTFKSLMWKGLARWTAENVGQEIAQDLSIMASKQTLGLAQYTAQEYLMTIPETALASLISSVPMGVIVQHRKVGLAKRLYAAGMKEENATKFADIILESGIEALEEDPNLLSDWVKAFQDVFKTSKVIMARNALEAGNKEQADNKKKVDSAREFAKERNSVGENVAVLHDDQILYKQDIGYTATTDEKNLSSNTRNDSSLRQYGDGAVYSLDKDSMIKNYQSKLLENLSRHEQLSLVTVRLPDNSVLLDGSKTIDQQSDNIKENFKKVIAAIKKKFNVDLDYRDFKDLIVSDAYNKIAQVFQQQGKVAKSDFKDGFNQVSAELDNVGIKGVVYQKEDGGKDVIVFREKGNVTTLSAQKLPMGRSLLSQKVRSLSEEDIDKMSLEEFIDKTGIKTLFDTDIAKKAVDPDKVIDAISSIMINSNLFSPAEARIAASHFVMMHYVQMALVGHSEVQDFVNVFPQIVNTFFYSAFDPEGEYSFFFGRMRDGNILKRDTNNPLVPNQALKRKLFGDKMPSEKDLKEVCRMVKMILNNKPYSGTKGFESERWYKILKEAFEENTTYAQAITVKEMLLPVINFEARLQKTSSFSNGNDGLVDSTYNIVDDIQLESHYMDLAILRILGLWGSTKNYQKEINGDKAGFWNKNRNKYELGKKYLTEDINKIHTDITAMYDIVKNKCVLPNGKKRYNNVNDVVFSFQSLFAGTGTRGFIDANREKNVDVIAIAPISSPDVPLHEFGHEIFFIVMRTLQDLHRFKPKKAVKIVESFAKVYEDKYNAKFDMNEFLTGNTNSVQNKRVHELFADLYAKSVVEGLLVEGNTRELNDLFIAARTINRIIRNPAATVRFIDEKGAVTDKDNKFNYELWQNTWEELNRKEDFVTLLKVRNNIIDGIKVNKNATQMYYEVLGDISSMPNTNTKILLMRALKTANNEINALNAHAINNILVKAAVEDMFGVQVLNQDLIEQMEADQAAKSIAETGKTFAMVKGAFKKYLPEKWQNLLTSAYVRSVKSWDQVSGAVKDMVENDEQMSNLLGLIRKFVEPLSTTAKKLGGRVYGTISYAVFSEKQLQKAFDATYTRVYDVYSKMSDEDKAEFDNACHEQNWAQMITVMLGYTDDANDLINELKTDIDSAYSIYERIDPNGDGVGKIEGYFPRSIKNLEGMIDYMSRVPEYKKMADEMSEARDFNEAISTYVLSTYGEGYKAQMHEAANTRKRRFEVVPADLRQFYMSPLEALQKYYTDLAASYGRFVMFGRGANAKLQNDSFTTTAMLNVGGKMVEAQINVFKPTKNWNRALKELGFYREEKTPQDREYNKKLAEVLEGTFYRGNPHPGLTIFRTVNNIATINNFFTAMSNLVDFAITTYRYGFSNTMQGAKAVFDKKNIVEYNELMTDLYKEFDMDSYNLNRWYNKVFKWSGFSLMDIFGKQASINAAFLSAKEKLQKDDKSIYDKISSYMGGDPNLISGVISDILNDRVTDDVKFFLFNELSGQQPLTVLDVPYYYNRYPYMRIFYQFRTFMLRQFDFFRNEVLMPELKKNPLKALKNVAGFMGFMLAFGIPKEVIKAFLLGQPLDISDEIISQILAVGMLNKYSYYDVKNKNFGSALMHSTIIPPVPVVSRLASDAKNVIIGKKVGKNSRKRIGLTEIQSIKDLPVAGEFMYWWMGGGSDMEFDVRL